MAVNASVRCPPVERDQRFPLRRQPLELRRTAPCRVSAGQRGAAEWQAKERAADRATHCFLQRLATAVDRSKSLMPPSFSTTLWHFAGSWRTHLQPGPMRLLRTNCKLQTSCRQTANKLRKNCKP